MMIIITGQVNEQSPTSEEFILSSYVNLSVISKMKSIISVQA